MNRRKLLQAGLLAVAASSALAGPWPDRPIKIIVPGGPASPSDVAVRSIQDQLAQRLGQAIVIENRAGGQGTVGTDALVKSAPDGYTLGVVNLQTAASPALRTKSPFDPVRDLQPVGQLTVESPIIIVRESLGVASLKELIERAKQQPGKLNFGSAGSGSPSHLGMELLSRQAGVRLTHVPYKTAVAAVADVEGGQIDVALIGSAAAQQAMVSGRVRALAVSAPQRVPTLPSVPTMAEAGYGQVRLQGWTGLVAPVGTDPAIVERLNQALASVLSMPVVIGRLAAAGSVPRSSSVVEFKQLIAVEVKRWGQVIAEAKINAE